MVSIIKGYDCILAVSSKSSKDKIDMLRTMGAKVYVCPATYLRMMKEVITMLPKDYMKKPKALYISINISNDLNIDAHYKTTGPEIWEQTGGQITHLIACSGTGGTISGTAKFLKEMNLTSKF